MLFPCQHATHDSCHAKFCSNNMEREGSRGSRRRMQENSILGNHVYRLNILHVAVMAQSGLRASWSTNKQQQIQLDHGIRHRHRIAIKQALPPSGKKDCPNNFLYSCCCTIHTFKQRRSQQQHHHDTTTRHGHRHTRRSGTWLAQEIPRRPRRATSPRTMAFSQCR